MSRSFYVYILTNYTKTVLYTGVTNDLQQRIIEHFLDTKEGQTFAGKYKTYYLLHFEIFDTPMSAINREKEIKGWNRQKKMNLIQSENPTLRFLNGELFDEWPPTGMFHRKDV
jgi:putative endonuclease